jgi:hypothetical protein
MQGLFYVLLALGGRALEGRVREGIIFSKYKPNICNFEAVTLYLKTAISCNKVIICNCWYNRA